MSIKKSAIVSLVILQIMGIIILFTGQTAATDDADYVVTTIVDSPDTEWEKLFNNNSFHIIDGKLREIRSSGSPVVVSFTDEGIKVADEASGTTTVYAEELFDPEIVSNYPNIQLLYTVFLKDLKWLQYSKNSWESDEPIVVNNDGQVKSLKGWIFTSDEDLRIEKISLIDEESDIVDIQLVYMRADLKKPVCISHQDNLLRGEVIKCGWKAGKAGDLF